MLNAQLSAEPRLIAPRQIGNHAPVVRVRHRAHIEDRPQDMETIAAVASSAEGDQAVGHIAAARSGVEPLPKLLDWPPLPPAVVAAVAADSLFVERDEWSRLRQDASTASAEHSDPVAINRKTLLQILRIVWRPGQACPRGGYSSPRPSARQSKGLPRATLKIDHDARACIDMPWHRVCSEQMTQRPARHHRRKDVAL